MKILVACEYSGVVRNAFKAKGHDVTSCDILPADDGSKDHYQGDIKDILYDKWDMIIAHPPCTRLTNSGVCHLYNKDGSSNLAMWKDLDNGAAFFNTFLDHPCDKICIENPIPHKYAIERFTGNKKYTQIIQPWMFGHTETKATCLWLKGLPLLKPTNVVNKGAIWTAKSGKRMSQWYYDSSCLPPKEREKMRNKTFQGIADAMANQWGNVC